MNKITRDSDFALSGKPAPRRTTQAAEGTPRLHWSLTEFEQLIETGILGKDDRVELIGGEIVPMAAKGRRHELVRDELLNLMFRGLPVTLRLSSEIGWRPNEDSYLEPDLLSGPKKFSAPAMPPEEVVLAVEIADSSLRYDTGLKADIYNALGVREYWVVNAITLETRVHREPGDGRYADVQDFARDKMIVPHLVPELALKMADLGIE